MGQACGLSRLCRKKALKGMKDCMEGENAVKGEVHGNDENHFS